MDNSLLDIWPENWSSSDSDESGYSDDSISSPKMEAVHINGESLLLPQDMCEKPEIFKDILSSETWNSFTEDQRKHLEAFLPSFPENDSKEKAACLEMLFSGSNICFGNPLDEFHSNLKAGNFRPDISKMRSMLRKTKFKDYRRREKWRMFKLVKSVLLSRARLADEAVNGEKPMTSGAQNYSLKQLSDVIVSAANARFNAELALLRNKIGDSNPSSDDDSYPDCGVSLLKRSRRKEFGFVGGENGLNNSTSSGAPPPVLGSLSTGPNPWDHSGFPSSNPYLPDKPPNSYTKLLATHYKRRSRKKIHPGLLTDDITMDAVAQRCKMVKRPLSSTHSSLSSHHGKPPAPPVKKTKIKVEEDDLTEVNSSAPKLAPLNTSTNFSSLLDSDDVDMKVDIEVVDDVKPFISPSHHLHQPAKVTKPMSRKSEEPPVRKLSLESMLESGVSVSTAARRNRAESSDSHFRQQRTEPGSLHSRVQPTGSKAVQPVSRPYPNSVFKTSSTHRQTQLSTLKGDLKPGKVDPIKQASLVSSIKTEAKVLPIKTESKTTSTHLLSSSSSISKTEHKPMHTLKVETKTQTIKSSLSDYKQQQMKVEPKPHIVKMELKPQTIKLEDKLTKTESEVILPLPSFKKLKSETDHARGTSTLAASLDSCGEQIRVKGSIGGTIISSGMAGLRGIMTPATLSDLKGIDMMALPVDIDDSSIDDIKVKVEEGETHACFFSLIRDIITSTPDHRIELGELEMRLKAWAVGPLAPMNTWYMPGIHHQLVSALLFLTGESTDLLPDEYVPYIEYKTALCAYQWIGAGRDSDHRLVALCSIWAAGTCSAGTCQPGAKIVAAGSSNVSVTQQPTGLGVSNTKAMSTQASAPPTIGVRVDGAAKEVVLSRTSNVTATATPTPPELAPRGPAVQPTSPGDRHLFRLQETERYCEPGKAFTYRVGSTVATLGPVRSSGISAKARGHSLLIPERPKCVTILELVRDAVARLPAGQGTRADIVTLLKDSQYLLPDAAENVLSSVVSGALDRLHSETDPSVKYDPKRKIWVYLHAGRTSVEFERLHALGMDSKPSRSKPRSKPKPKKDSVIATTVLEDGTTLISGDGTSATVGASGANDDMSKVVKAVAAASRAKAKSPTKSIATATNVPTGLTVHATIASPQVKKAAASSIHTVSTAMSTDSSSQTKSIVKVIAATQSGTPGQGGLRSKMEGASGPMIVMKQTSDGGSSGPTAGQQMIVISGAGGTTTATGQFVLEPKQHKHIQQLLSKQAVSAAVGTSSGGTMVTATVAGSSSDSSHQQTSQAERQGAATLALQQQLQQLILAKQQQILAEQGKANTAKSAPPQVMVMKPAGQNSGEKQTLQQMILLKGSSQQESQGIKQMFLLQQPEKTQASDHPQLQHLLLKQPASDVQQISQNQLQALLKGTASSTGEVQQISGSQLQQLLKPVQSEGTQHLQALLKQQPPSDVQQISQSQLQQLLKSQDIQTQSVKQTAEVQQISQSQLQALLKQQTTAQQTDPPVHQITQSHLQQIMLKQQEQQVQQISPQQLQQLLAKQQSSEGTQVQQISQHQLQQILAKQQSSEGTQVQQISQQQLQQILAKQQAQATSEGTQVQQISQQQLQQLLLKQQQQQQQMIIVKQHDQKQIQVITSQAPKGGTLTLAQLQQLQHKSGSAAGLLTTPRVVATNRVQAARGSLSQFAVVSLPQSQQRMGGTAGTVTVTSSSGEMKSVTSGGTTTARLATLSSKQVLLAATTSGPTTSAVASTTAGKPTATTQNVVVGTTSSGQAVLVGAGGPGGTSGLAVLHQGPPQQILIPSNTLKTLQALKVIPITTGRQTAQVILPGGRSGGASGTGTTGGGQQVFARLVTGGPARTVATAQTAAVSAQTASAAQTTHQDQTQQTSTQQSGSQTS